MITRVNVPNGADNAVVSWLRALEVLVGGPLNRIRRAQTRNVELDLRWARRLFWEEALEALCRLGT